MKFLQIILICLRVTILMSCHQVDVLLCKYKACKYYYSVYNELFFFHFFFFKHRKGEFPQKIIHGPQEFDQFTFANLF